MDLRCSSAVDSHRTVGVLGVANGSASPMSSAQTEVHKLGEHFRPTLRWKYGREFLPGLRAHTVGALPNGSIYHQLSPMFLTEDPKSAKELREQVVAHCARAGLKVVYKAPYHLPAPLRRRNHRAYELGGRVALRQAGNLIYLHAKYLGSTLAATDGAGVDVAGSRTSYLPYGDSRSGGTGLPREKE